jgi:uncharacterized protein YegP (UPF0339 family)
MSVQPFIDKYPKAARSKKSYEFLRTQGIAYLQQLAAEKWTDHNIHDPGITQLEIICYALTELGYKTEYAIEDILAESSSINEKCGLTDSTTQPTNNDTFYTPAEILPSNPLTLDDWRKIIIDVPLVKNSWLLMLDESLPPVYRDTKHTELTFTENNQTKRLNIDGLFEVKVEFENDEILGDLNSWELSFPISDDGLQIVKLYVKPEWSVFFENNLDADEFQHAYMGSFNSIEDTAIYSGTFYLDGNGLTIPFQVNIESPLAKTDSNKLIIDEQLLLNIDEIANFLRSRIIKCKNAATNIESRLHQQRNLCEDFVSIRQSEVEEVGVCTDIEIQANADIETIFADIYFALENYFSPAIPFYTLEEMLETGDSLDTIFNGPLLHHGFIKQQELLNSEYKSIIHVSDIIQILMDIDGIVAIKKIQLSKYFCGLVLNDGEDWCLPVTAQRSLKFNAQQSKIVFYKGLIPYNDVRKAEIALLLEDKKALHYRSRLQAKTYDIAVPKGVDKKLRQHFSIQNDFPLVYGIGGEGLALSSTDLRKAQAKQLKAFLKLIDQILANYLAQLSEVKNLFSLNKDIKRTYFAQLLFSLPETYKITQSTLNALSSESWTLDEINKLQPLVDQPGTELNEFSVQLESLLSSTFYQAQKTLLEELCKIPQIKVPNLPNGSNLVREFVLLHKDSAINWDKPSSYTTEWKRYLLQKKEMHWNALCEREPILESSTTYEQRKNHFLDHLLARFGEQFTDYVLLSLQLDDGRTADDLIEDKINFLKSYPELSHDRGKGFDYRRMGQVENVSGLEKRASRLVGIKSWQRMRFIAGYSDIFETFQELNTDGITEWRFRLRSPDGDILFSSTRHYLDSNTLNTAMKSALIAALQRSRYLIKANKKGEYFFVLMDEKQDIICQRRKYYHSKFEVEKIISTILNTLKFHEFRCEGFHLVEHMLLRPISPDSDLFTLSKKADCSPGYQDPYSFRTTAVVPYWSDRFQNMDFRRFFEETLRKEIPAHIHIKVCWVDQLTMENFEQVFFRWLKLKSTRVYTHPALLTNNQLLIDEQNRLLHLLEDFNSIYPETHLFDCTQEGDSQSILLNQTKLGSNKGD